MNRVGSQLLSTLLPAAAGATAGFLVGKRNTTQPISPTPSTSHQTPQIQHPNLLREVVSTTPTQKATILAINPVVARNTSSATPIASNINSELNTTSNTIKSTTESTTTSALSDLHNLLSPEKILTDEESFDLYGHDASRRKAAPNPTVILFPRSTKEVQAIVALAHQHNAKIVPSGGRTGLSGGASAQNREWVLCLDEMDQILEFNREERTVTCQAGVVTRDLQSFAKENGLYYPVNFASAGQSQLGGNIATNAGGIHVIGYGNTRDWVAGLTVITPDGECLQLDRNLTKDATGYDLKQLFIGSEGTLGIIVEATMKLTTPPKDQRVTLMGINNIQDVGKIKQQFLENYDLNAIELISRNALPYVNNSVDLSPFANRDSNNLPPYFLLVQCANIKPDSEAAASFDKLLAAQQSSTLVTHSLTTNEPEFSETLWALREGISSALSEFKPIKYDISVRPSLIGQFVDELTTELDAIEQKQGLAFQFVWFGHVGDGNLHLNFVPKTTDQALTNDHKNKSEDYKSTAIKTEEKSNESPINNYDEKCTTTSEHRKNNNHDKRIDNDEAILTDVIFSLIKKYRGSISAEHGLGTLKKEYIEYTRSETEIDIMSKIKSALDQEQTINPGKIFK